MIIFINIKIKNVFVNFMNYLIDQSLIFFKFMSIY
jgi:hypothetical protein